MNQRAKISLTMAVALSVVGCASYRPMVMPESVGDPYVYEQDLSMCQDYAQRISPGGAAVAGAVFGGLLGAAFGALIGNDEFMRDSMRWGAAQGAVNGAGSAANVQINVIRRCMSERGYAVIY